MTEGLKDKGWVVIGSDDFGDNSELKISLVMLVMDMIKKLVKNGINKCLS